MLLVTTHGKRFHQDMAVVEIRNLGKYNASMIGDFCWVLHRDGNRLNIAVLNISKSGEAQIDLDELPESRLLL